MGIYVNNIEIESFIFPGGECHVNVENCEVIAPHSEGAPELLEILNGECRISVGDSDFDHIIAELNNSDAIMKLLLTVDAIRTIRPTGRITLEIPYFPYARQDRVCNKGEAFSLNVMAELINSLKLHEVTIFDPHSDILPKLLDRCKVIEMSDLLLRSNIPTLIDDKEMILIAPDKGARDKVKSFAKKIGAEFICANKRRDPKTGNITHTEISDLKSDRNYIILDDICDGGRTFTELAHLVKPYANKIYLYVTHGIFSKGLEVFAPYFEHIFCYDTMLDEKSKDVPFLTVISEEK